MVNINDIQNGAIEDLYWCYWMWYRI